VIKNQNGRRAYNAEDHVIITALLILQPRWSQEFFVQALDVDRSFVSNVKSKAIRLGLMNKKRIPTAKGIEYLEWAKTQYDIFGYVKKINQFKAS
jgi:hypothetical protein